MNDPKDRTIAELQQQNLRIQQDAMAAMNGKDAEMARANQAHREEVAHKDAVIRRLERENAELKAKLG